MDECDAKTKSFLKDYCSAYESSVMSEAKSICPIESSQGMNSIIMTIDAKADFAVFCKTFEGKGILKNSKSDQSVVTAVDVCYEGFVLLKDTKGSVFGESLEGLAKRDTILVPIVLTKLINALDHASRSGKITHREILGFCKEIDAGQDDFQKDHGVLDGALKMFFRMLDGAVIPKQFWNELIGAASIMICDCLILGCGEDEMLVKVHEGINKLADPNYATLKCITGYLAKYAFIDLGDFRMVSSGMSVKSVGVVWGPLLMDSGKMNPVVVADEYRDMCRVIETIVGNYEHIFEV